MSINVSIFPTRNQAGLDLAGGCQQLFEKLLPGKTQVTVAMDAGPVAFLKACAFADLVILDATVAPPGEHNYDLLRGIERNLDHVLVVSRSYLPMNVRGMRSGGAPIYPGQFTNGQIETWLKEQINSKTDRLTLPRPWSEKLTLGIGAFRNANRKDRQGRQARHQIFLSYRGNAYASALALKTRIEAKAFHDTAKQVLLYAPEQLALADEILSPLQRWNVLSIISDVIFDCAEFWIVETDDYLQSWWTRGELATYAYTGGKAEMIVYNVEHATKQPAGPEYRITLTDEQHRRMARYFANSHPDMMGPESMQIMRQMNALGLARFYKLAGDEVFTPEFWNYPLLQCPACTVRHQRNARFDVDQFLKNQYPTLYPIAPDLLEQAAQSQQPLRCPGEGCSATYRILPTPPRYLWYPLPTGPTKHSLEEFLTYRLEPL